MGGRGSGGRRIGSGKKPKSELEHAISGTSGPRGVVLQHPSGTAIAPIEEFAPPAELKGQSLQMWQQQAPKAFAARTLTSATTVAFVRYCRAAVLEATLATSKRYAGGPNHRGLMQRVATWEKDFMLAPLGKPMGAEAPAVANPLDRFTKKVGA
jgi:hypothetical protein